MAKQQSAVATFLPIISAGLLFWGVLGVVLLCFFGILIVMDAYAFNITPMISDNRNQKAASCFIAAGYHLILAVLGGIGMFGSRILKK